jgi:inosose dehydratase
MTRRVFMATLGSLYSASGSPAERKMSVEAYIFQQYAQSLKKPLGAVLPQVFEMTKSAGFRNIELNNSFFADPVREKTISLIRSLGLQMPSCYVGGAMHEQSKADETIAKALVVGDLCRPFGCKAIVTNPDPKPDEGEKTDRELEVQAASLNRMGRALAKNGLQLRVHHHTPQLVNKAREWRHILRYTDPEYVQICVDVDWAYEAGYEPVTFLQEAGKRVGEIHVRSARNKVWLEDLEDSDIDYSRVAEYLRGQQLNPLIVIELAYRSQTKVTRTLEEDLRRSRLYAERVFGVKADAY